MLRRPSMISRTPRLSPYSAALTSFSSSSSVSLSHPRLNLSQADLLPKNLNRMKVPFSVLSSRQKDLRAPTQPVPQHRKLRASRRPRGQPGHPSKHKVQLPDNHRRRSKPESQTETSHQTPKERRPVGWHLRRKLGH